jgi:hypothetical protein
MQQHRAFHHNENDSNLACSAANSCQQLSSKNQLVATCVNHTCACDKANPPEVLNNKLTQACSSEHVESPLESPNTATHTDQRQPYEYNIGWEPHQEPTQGSQGTTLAHHDQLCDS